MPPRRRSKDWRFKYHQVTIDEYIELENSPLFPDDDKLTGAAPEPRPAAPLPVVSPGRSSVVRPRRRMKCVE